MTRPARTLLNSSSLTLGRVAGVPIAVHFSWFLIAGLITFSLASHFRVTQPGWTPVLVWTASAATAALFFVTLVLHELAHAVVAASHGLTVRSITLFAFGGLARIERDANTARAEFYVAIAGPLTSFAIGFGCIGAADLLRGSDAAGPASIVASVLQWLGSINIMLALFNLVPGFPLDGGRVLRAGLWALYGDGPRATRQAARVGQVIAAGFIALGLSQFFIGSGGGGLWLAFIGWFLLMAVQSTFVQMHVDRTLKTVRVGDVMANECISVDADLNLRTLVNDVLLRTGRRCVVVERNGGVLGLVTLHEVRAVPEKQWDTVMVHDVMRPLESLKTLPPEASADEAFRTMASEDLNQLPVVAHGTLAGVITRGQILQLLQARSELGLGR